MPAATTVSGVFRYPLGRSRRAAKNRGPTAQRAFLRSDWIAASSSGVGVGEILLSFSEKDRIDWRIWLETEKAMAKMVDRVLVELERRGWKGRWDFDGGVVWSGAIAEEAEILRIG